MRFLRIASTDFRPRGDRSSGWPYLIDVSVGSPEVKVGFAEGVGHGVAGGVFPLGDALSSSWTTHFQQADGEWILPHLERMAQGEVVEESELVAAFTERHGRAPEAYETKR